MRFSQRTGITTVEKFIQKESIDDDLRHSLWSAATICYWDKFNKLHYSLGSRTDYIKGSNLEGLFHALWMGYFKQPTDTIPIYFYDKGNGLLLLRRYFYEALWYEVYDFLEFIASYGPENMCDEFISTCNHFLDTENSAYRFIDRKIIEITSNEEIDEIENAISNSSPYYGVKEHLTSAIAMLSDRENPDYRNSIKESISAVESLCKTITGDNKATLGSALKILESNGKIHPALKSALSSLYGYTNNADGIRHALIEESNLSNINARFMLIICSAFINYIIASSNDS